jgi:hypothetical protein
MPLVGFGPAIPAIERRKTYIIEPMATTLIYQITVTFDSMYSTRDFRYTWPVVERKEGRLSRCTISFGYSYVCPIDRKKINSFCSDIQGPTLPCCEPYLLTYYMEQSPSWEANWFCS